MTDHKELPEWEAAFEKHRIEQGKIPGMPGLSARPCFKAGYDIALAASKAKVDAVPLSAEVIAKFDRLAGRGMHELRTDELTDYLRFVGIGYGFNSQEFVTASDWIVSELDRKTNDERILAVKLDKLRTTPAHEPTKPAAAVASVDTPEFQRMTAHRAVYFMERFKREEKLLGPNEQAAVDFVIAMLEATQAEKARGVPVAYLYEWDKGSLIAHVAKPLDQQGMYDFGIDGLGAVATALVKAAPQAPHVEPVSERDAKISDLIAQIRAADGMARRDYLFDQIISTFEADVPAVAEGDVRDAAAKLCMTRAMTYSGNLASSDPETSHLASTVIHELSEMATAIRALRTDPAKPSVDLVEAIKGLLPAVPGWGYNYNYERGVNDAAALVATHLKGLPK